jgi:hypothetical protein
MSQRDRQRQRPTFRVTACEALEGRELLSGAGHPGMSPAQVWQRFLAKHPALAVQLQTPVAQVGSAATVASHARIVTGGRPTVPTVGHITVPENSPVFRGRRFAVSPQAFVTTATPGTYAFHPPTNAALAAQFGQFGQSLDGATITSASAGSTVPTIGTVAATGGINAGINPLAVPVGNVVRSAAVSSGGTTAAVSPGFGPAMVMPLAGPFGNATLTPADVQGLKSAVDTFANNYTSGKDATADTAAVTALQNGLADVAQNVWSETHVAAKADVAKLQQAVTDFAGAYTSGQNTSQDAAAWKALQGAVAAFGSALTNPSAPPASGATTPVPTMPPGLAFGGWKGPGAGIGAPSLVGPILDGTALTAGEVTSLKTAVDTFASNYTSGTDASADKAAVSALQTALGAVAQQHWQDSAPVVDPSGPPVTPPAGGPIQFTAVQSSVSVPSSSPSGTA